MVERPTLLYLHGGPGLDHSHYLQPTRDRLGESAQLVFYDHRGNGRSDWRTPDEWNLDTWADDIVRLCDTLGIERPVVLGQSFGGFVAQHYIARHPEHPRKVILASTGARLDLDVIGAAFARMGSEDAGTAVRRFFGGDESAFGDFLQHCIPLYSTEPMDPDEMARMVMNVDVMNGFFGGEAKVMDLRAGLAATKCPVLVLAGERDPVLPVELNREIVASIPHGLAHLEVVPGVSHLQVVSAATDLIRDFVLAT